MTSCWLTVVGIGDDGLAGLKPATLGLIAEAELLVGGERHQAMVKESEARRLTWEGGVHLAAEEIVRWRGRRVVVLATGDPMWFGGGANLARFFPVGEMQVLPHPGAFSLAAARMLWPLADIETLTVHGRPLETLALSLQPGVRLLVLSRDGETPGKAAALLTERGYGPSRVTVLEHLGGPLERRVDGVAERWDHPRRADLNTLAIECEAAPEVRALPRFPGLPDDAFESDGQISKREVRAATLSALSPLPGQVLWDIGAGSGSIAIEWLRCVPHWRLASGRQAQACAVERNKERCAMIARNAARLGVPQLAVIEGSAPEILAGLSPPDSIFIGGGITLAGLLETCWDALPVGGRMVANGVTIEATSRLFAFASAYGGALTRIAVARAEPLGGLTAFRALMEVTQYVGIKPAQD